MPSEIEQVVEKYSDLYQKLYKREPSGLRILSADFILVNNMQIRLSDLKLLIYQLEEEYRAQQSKRRSTVLRLIGWLRRS